MPQLSARARRHWPALRRLPVAIMVAIIATGGFAAAPGRAAPTPSPSSPTGSGSAAPGSASTPAKATFGLQPATPGRQDSRAILTYQMTAGGTFSDNVAVDNFGTIPLSLQLYVADVDNAADGSLAAGGENTKPTDAGAWVHLAGGSHTVNLAAGTAKGPTRLVLPISIAVPAKATPGDHAAAVVASLATIGKNPKGENVRLLQRVALRVFVRVNGAIRPHLVIENPHVDYHGTLNPVGSGQAVLTYTLRNDGNVKVGAQQKLSLSGWLGATGAVPSAADIELLLPGNAVHVRQVIKGVRPEVRLTAKIAVRPLKLVSDSDPPLGAFTVKAFGWAVPWSQIVAVAVLMLLVVGAWSWLRRLRRRRPSGGGRHKHGKPRKPTGPTGPVKSAAPMRDRVDITP